MIQSHGPLDTNDHIIPYFVKVEDILGEGKISLDVAPDELPDVLASPVGAALDEKRRDQVRDAYGNSFD